MNKLVKVIKAVKRERCNSVVISMRDNKEFVIRKRIYAVINEDKSVTLSLRKVEGAILLQARKGVINITPLVNANIIAVDYLTCIETPFGIKLRASLGKEITNYAQFYSKRKTGYINKAFDCCISKQTFNSINREHETAPFYSVTYHTVDGLWMEIKKVSKEEFEELPNTRALSNRDIKEWNGKTFKLNIRKEWYFKLPKRFMDTCGIQACDQLDFHITGKTLILEAKPVICDVSGDTITYKNNINKVTVSKNTKRMCAVIRELQKDAKGEFSTRIKNINIDLLNDLLSQSEIIKQSKEDILFITETIGGEAQCV